MASDDLGLVLVWTKNHRSKFVLEAVSSIIQICVSDYFMFSINILVSALKWDDDADIPWSSIERIQCQNAIGGQHATFADIWCSMDGIELMIESCSDMRTKLLLQRADL